MNLEEFPATIGRKALEIRFVGRDDILRLGLVLPGPD